jgi:hypothetical protein
MVAFEGDSVTIVSKEGTTASDLRFVLDSSGAIKWAASPVLSLVSFDLEFRTHESLDPVPFCITTRVDDSEFQERFTLRRAFPLTVEERLRFGEMIQLKLTNISDLPLLVSNTELPELKIDPGESSYLLHQRSTAAFSLVVRNEIGEKAEKSWDLNEGITVKRINAILNQPTPLTVGTNVTMELELPSCSYQVQESSDFLVFGRTRRKNFDGGSLKLVVVPIRVGLLNLPKIVINDRVRTIHPLYVNVTAIGVCSSGPLAASE